MKKTLFSLLLLSSTIVFAQNPPPPPPVRVSFERDFPGSNNVRWDLRNDQWHATYKDKYNKDADIYYDVNGSRVERHIIWGRRNVPLKHPANGNSNVLIIKRPKAPSRLHIKIPPPPPRKRIHIELH